MKTYCKSCGQANNYIGQKPSFCGHCGTDMNKISLTAVQNNEIHHSYNRPTYRKLTNPFLGSTTLEVSKESLDGENTINIKI